MQTEKEIYDYYEKIASTYDKDRFGNTYGSYIHKQEYEILSALIPKTDKSNILDLGCGTGRLLEFANYGIDFSSKMINEAFKKHPDKKLFIEDAAHTNFKDKYFDVVISFHTLMHLTNDKTDKIITEAHRLLKPKGRFIFDIPSKKRKKLFRNKQNNWHGANEYAIKEITKIIDKIWEIKSVTGILFFPIHRIPEKFRKVFLMLDTLMCKSVLKEYSSYLVIEIEKK